MKGLRLHRLWTPGLGKGSITRRLIDYAWFYLAAAIRLLTLPRQDVVISLTTPPFIAWTAVVHGWLHPATRLVLWNMDCYPEALVGAGFIRQDGWLARLLRWQNRQLFSRLHGLVCPEAAMERLLTSEYVAADEPLRSLVISNWEPADRFNPEDASPEWDLAHELGMEIPAYAVHIGNAGYGHEFETAAEAAMVVQGDPFGFVFIGGGVRWPWLEANRRVRALSHWHLMPYLPEDQLAAAMAGACCALITLRDSFLGVISPSKLYAALAMGLPILYFGPQGSNVDEAIQRFGCGVSLRHGNVQGAVDFLRQLVGNDGFAADLSRRARLAFDSAYTEAQALPAFDQLIKGLGI